MDSTVGDEARVAWPGRCSPRLITVGRYTQEERGFRRDFANHCLSIHLFSYACRMRSGDLQLDIRPDTLVLTPPNARQAFDIPTPGVHWGMVLLPQHAGGAMLALPRHRALGRTQALEARNRLERIHENHRRAAGRADHPAALAASAGAQSFLCWLAAGELAETRIDTARQEAALHKAEDLLANPTCAKVPISEIARRAGMSQNRLAAVFRVRHGMTMAAYRRRALAAFVQEWLTTTDVPMAVVARQIELPDARRLNKFFRHAVGMSPTAWRSGRQAVITSAPRPSLDIPVAPVAPPARRR